MELSRVLAGVIAPWIPMDGGEARRRSSEDLPAKAFVGRALLKAERLQLRRHSLNYEPRKTDTEPSPIKNPGLDAGV